MSVLSIDYTDTQVIIYDTEGNHLIDTRVTSHDKVNRQIQVAIMPPGLKVNDECMVFILTSPTPCEYQGKIKRLGGMYSIAMIKGQVKENRAATRYKVNTPAKIDSYISDGKNYDLLNSVSVTLINISVSGTRFRAPFYSLNKGDRFRINMTVSGSDKSLNAEVTNTVDKEPEYSDYGCRFV